MLLFVFFICKISFIKKKCKTKTVPIPSISILLQCVRVNEAVFINKTINKKSMKSSRLRNKVLITKGDFDRKRYNKQRICCVSLTRMEKINVFNNISIR